MGDDAGRRLPQLAGRELLVLVAPAPEAAPALRSGRSYQCTPLIRCANATPSADTSSASSLRFSPRAAALSGKSLNAVLRITSTDFGAMAYRTSPNVPRRVATF